MPFKHFFKQIQPFTNFLDFDISSNYLPAPEEWFLCISDVAGSTKAITQGRYKTVNVIGASSIVALVNTLGTMDFPFIFGGDGATALVPDTSIQSVKEALRAVRRHSQESFGLELRVGLVPMKDLYAEGLKVEVAKFGLNQHQSIACFRGSGLSVAETWIKSGRYKLDEGIEGELGKVLKGLSCRWAPLQNSQGCMLSVIIKSRQKNDNAGNLLTELLARIDDIVHLSSQDAHPIKPEKMRPESLGRASAIESRYFSIQPRWLARIVISAQIILLGILRRLNMSVEGIKIRQYVQDNATHSDFRKFDDMLRLVFDCSQGRKLQLMSLLESYRLENKIYYGVYESESALLTCFVQGLNKGMHLHFVDGSDGGYAMAAKQMKEQMAGEMKKST